LRAFIEEGWLDKVKVVKTNSAGKVSYESLAVVPRLGDEGKVRLERPWKTCVENELIPLKAKLASLVVTGGSPAHPLTCSAPCRCVTSPKANPPLKPQIQGLDPFAAKLQMVIALPVFGQVMARTTFGPQFI
jgi:hypothetical protein